MRVIDVMQRSLRKVIENATAGATCAANVASTPGGRKGKVGGLGVGFNPNGDHGIYQDKKKKSKSGDGVIRR